MTQRVTDAGGRSRAAAGRAPRSQPSELRRAGLAVDAEVHDRHQLEVRFNFAIGTEPGPRRYGVEAFFFVPRNVGVSKANYGRQDFYADVTAHMRLDAAALPLEELADPQCPGSPLHALWRAHREFREAPRPPPSPPVAVHVKLYAFLFTEAVRAEGRRLRRLLEPPAPPGRDAAGGRAPESATPADPDRAVVGAAPEAAEPPRPAPEGAPGASEAAAREAFERELDGALSRMRAGLRAFRRVRSAFWPFAELAHRSLEDSMRSADEYMSLFLEQTLAKVSAALGRPSLADGTGFGARMRLRIAALAEEEAAYRARYGYLVLGESGAGEYFTYRASLLKKTVHGALYLDAREAQSDTFLRNTVGAVAAALGAIWALATQLPATLAGLPGRTQALVFMAAVGAYVLKDRIKAITNEYLASRLRKFDHVSRLYGATLGTVGLGMLRARLSEVMRFQRPEEVPPAVLRMRLARRTVRHAEAGAETVIHYRKVLEVGPRDADEPLPEGYWVRDILRFNVRHFLVRLDEPQEAVDYFDPARGAFGSTRLPKVYHVNLVLAVSRTGRDGVRQERMEHLRIVLDKQGIVRVDLVDETAPRTLPGPPPRFRLPRRRA